MRRLLLFILLALSLPQLAYANAKEAFRLAERGDWGKAQAQARTAGSSTLSKLITWQYLLDAGSGASFTEITQFLSENPNWPEQKRLRVRAELALRENREDHQEILRWFGEDTPITGVGKIALARALLVETPDAKQKIESLVRAAWKDGDFDDVHEKDILNTFGDMLIADDHIERTSRLLWEEKTAAAKRMLPLLSEDQKHLAEARIALINNKTLSVLAVARVPKSLKDDPGLLYDRMQYRVRRDDDKGAREILLSAPDSPPYPEKWWRQREKQVRVAIDDGNYDVAEKLLAAHGDLPARELADAAWLSGWLKLEFLKKPQPAFEIFSQMYESVSYPVSRSRAAFWAARAAEAQGNKSTASDWFAKARLYPTTYYGQLAALRHDGSAPLKLPEAPSIAETEKAAFEESELAQAVRLCLKYDAKDLAAKLLGAIIEDGTPAEAALAAQMVSENGTPQLGVRAAKKALQKNIVLVGKGYPQPKTPPGIAIERPLALAISRQESEFDPQAKSPAGALGMMQLLPRTAKEVAKKTKVRFDKKKLMDPQYNMQLGSEYLARMIESYDGSYVMAIAAYNAGPGNVRKWVRSFGTPGNDYDSAINWIEKIPFAETRNYVQRVLENLQVYRQLEKNNQPLKLAEDLTR